ncbi:MAG TPA: sigma-54 dependent transcriptional regulator [Verrucomicrobiae bacterium]|nr:sigma-54 dependent transcriptional regulator [Verrucomicrobiae bacterium]
MNKTMLIVDDDTKIASLLVTRLRKQGHTAASVNNGTAAVTWAEENKPALVLLDVRLPDMNGLEVLKKILAAHPQTYVIMISAHADVQMAVECIKLGAYDFVEKPFEFLAFDAKVKQVFRQLELEEEVASLKKELGAAYKEKSLVGKSEGMKKVFQAIDLAAKSEISVLIEGESGTGKELVARAIHFNGLQKNGPFVAINCGAIPENLLESEFFGHEKGSFTGAAMRKIGKFEQAQGGTLFLDEIGELPPALQVKLLRVLQEREIERVGGTQPIPIHTRFMTATNQDLKKMVAEGKFREDLFYRINVFPISIPPLRERKEDIPELFTHFVQQRRAGKPLLEVEEGAFARLADHSWPGNIRELENFVERLLLVQGEHPHVVTEEDIENLGRGRAEARVEKTLPSLPSDRVKTLGETEKSILERALQETGGNVTKASQRVQMSRDTFYRKMKKYAIVK